MTISIEEVKGSVPRKKTEPITSWRCGCSWNNSEKENECLSCGKDRPPCEDETRETVA